MIFFHFRGASMDEKKIRDRLLKENPEFKTVFKQHQEIDIKLGKISQKSFLSEEEKLEEKELKKKKLILKDKIYYLIYENSKSSS